MRGIEQRVHARGRARARRREQRHLMAAPHKRVAEQVDHRLDPAVAGRRDRDPWRREHRDAQPVCAHGSRPKEPDGRGRGIDRPARTGNGLAPHLEPLRLTEGALLPSACGASRSRYSSAAGSAEENILTATRARARHRGQCSTDIQRGFGLMLKPQRGQFRNDAADSASIKHGPFLD